MVTGNAFVHITKGVGMGYEMKCLRSKDVEIAVTGRNELHHYRYCDNGMEYRFDLEEILHIKLENLLDGDDEQKYYGISPLQAAWSTVVSSNEIFKAEASIFKNRGVVGLISNDSERPALPSDLEKLQESFQGRAGGAENFNKVLVTNQNVRYIQMGMSPQDLQLIANQREKLRILCSVFGLDSKLFGDGENSTYNNVNEAQKAAYLQVYIPVRQKINYELSNFLNPILRTDYYIEISRNQIEVLAEEKTIDQLIVEKINIDEITIDELIRIKNGGKNATTNKEL
jgi:HK97 family phage portal protein